MLTKYFYKYCIYNNNKEHDENYFYIAYNKTM